MELTDEQKKKMKEILNDMQEDIANAKVEIRRIQEKKTKLLAAS